MNLMKFFSDFSRKAATWLGHPIAFIFAIIIVIIWVILGPFFKFSDTWQLVINTATTIVTFIMIFLVQNTQNRDSEAMQIKLDELIRSHKGAHNALLDLEELTQKQLDQIRKDYSRLAEEARLEIEKKKGDTGTPDL